MSKRPSFRQRFRGHHVNWSQTLLRSAWNQFHTTLPLIHDSGSRKRLVLVTSELLGQFVSTVSHSQVLSLQSGEFMVTSSKADISETENLFSNFYCVSEIYVKFGVFSKKMISLIA